VLGAANITHAEKVRLLQKLRALEADIVIIDVGAGVGYNMLDFFGLGSRKLLVTTPQVTAIHDAYSFLKGAVLRVLHTTRTRPSRRPCWNRPRRVRGRKGGGDPGRLRDVRPELADKVFAELGRFGACLVGNQVMNRAHAGVFVRWRRPSVATWVWKFPCSAICVPRPRVHESVNRRRRWPSTRTAKMRPPFASWPGFAGDPAGRRGRFRDHRGRNCPGRVIAASPAPVAAKPEAATPPFPLLPSRRRGRCVVSRRAFQRIKPQWRAARASRPHPATGASALTTRSSRRLYLNTDRASRRTVRRSSHSSIKVVSFKPARVPSGDCANFFTCSESASWRCCNSQSTSSAMRSRSTDMAKSADRVWATFG